MVAHQAPPSLGFSRQEHWSGLPFPSPRHESENWKWSRSVLSDSSRPHGLQPTRLLHPWDLPVLEWVAIAFSDSEPSASYLLSKWIVNEWMQPLHRWPICSVVLSKFIVRLGAFVLFWCLHWPVTLAFKCWFYSRNTWAHILSRSEELPQTLFSSLFLSTFLQLKHWLRRQHEEIKFLSAQESHTSGPVTGRPPWSYLSFPASQSGKRREGWSSLRCFISMS